MADLVYFLPELALDADGIPRRIAIKGAEPRLAYGFSLAQIYGTVASLDLPRAYRRLRDEVACVDRILAGEFHLREPFALPEVSDDQIPAIVAALFDPRRLPTTSLAVTRDAGLETGDLETTMVALEAPRPFPLSRASRPKLQHTLAWADANMKLQVERVAEPLRLPDHAIRLIAESVLRAYCLLAKQADHRLARTMNFNHSMFLQDRVVNLLVGNALYWAPTQGQRGRLANRIALDMLRQFPRAEPPDLAALAVFMGVVWTNRPDVQSEYERAPERTIAELGDALLALRRWAINDIDRFLAEIASNDVGPLLVVLDDNGESVFDLALLQALLERLPALQVTFLVNRFPVGANLSLATLQEVLAHAGLSGLRRQLEHGRARLCIESQLLPSFEVAYLSATARAWLADAGIAYVKGVNFFETFQPVGLPRYYAFVVSGPMSAALTGCAEGEGVFARVPSGEAGYIYRTEADIGALRDHHARWEGQGS